MKHNNAVPREHFHKDWQRFVKTWFDQPARAVRRRTTRQLKSARIAPRPLHSLKPIVRCQTIKYNKRVRAGRGFTPIELKQAGINVREAKTIGIAVDKRRKNRSEEGLQINVERLKTYKSQLIVFPTTRAQKAAAKKSGTTIESPSTHKQVDINTTLPIQQQRAVLTTRKLTSDEKKPDRSVYQQHRKAHTYEKNWGKQEKRAKDKAADAGKGKKVDEDE